MLGLAPKTTLLNTGIDMPARRLQASEAESADRVIPSRRHNKRQKGIDTRRARLVESSSDEENVPLQLLPTYLVQTSSDEENVQQHRLLLPKRSRTHRKSPSALVDLEAAYTNEITRLKGFRFEEPLNQAFIKLLNQLNDLKPEDQATAKVPMQNLSAYCELLNQETPQDLEETRNLNTRRTEALADFKTSVEIHMLGQGNPLVQNIGIALLAFSAAILLIVAISPLLNLLTLSIAAAAVALPTAAVIPTTAVGLVTGIVGAIGIFGSRSSEPYNSAKNFIVVAEQSINLP